MQKKNTRKSSQSLPFNLLNQASKPAPTASASVPTVEHDPLLAEALRSLETPLEEIIAQSLEGAEQELDDMIRRLDEPITVPDDYDNYLDAILGPIVMREEEAAVDYMLRSIIATRWGVTEQDAPSVAQHLTMLDLLTYCVLTGEDPATAADPDQVAELLPVAQLAAAAINRLMSKTKEN